MAETIAVAAESSPLDGRDLEPNRRVGESILWIKDIRDLRVIPGVSRSGMYTLITESN